MMVNGKMIKRKEKEYLYLKIIKMIFQEFQKRNMKVNLKMMK